MSFTDWLAELLRQEQSQVKRLLSDRTALHFLIGWSIFESKCFAGSVNAGQIKGFAEKTVADGFDRALIDDALAGFHRRYQNPTAYRNLTHGRENAKFRDLTSTQLPSFSDADAVFYVVFVVFRYRNNMFHGNKGVDSWLQYRDQIERCSHIMQVLVSHRELRHPTLPEAATADALSSFAPLR